MVLPEIARLSKKFVGLSFATIALATTACEDTASNAETTTTESEIIGGFPIRGSALDAVGAIAIPLPPLPPPPPPPPPGPDGGVSDAGTSTTGLSSQQDTRLALLAERRAANPRFAKLIEGAPAPLEFDTHFPFCTATLIAPNAILTAEHCLEFLFGDEVFTIGFDGRKPRRTVRIEAVVAEQTIPGGFIGRGSDVAVALLAEPINDIKPLAYAPLPPNAMGQNFAGIGYGIRNNNSEAGLRYGGQMTLRGVGGNHGINAWGSFEEYLVQYEKLGIPIPAEEALPLFDLLPEYEATFGNAPGNAQACFGDSGGPILRPVNGELVVFGVTSGGLGSIDLICDWGGVYSMLARAAFDLVNQVLACGTVPPEGTCPSLNEVQRCAPPVEGGWEVVSTDCSLFGLICGADSVGEIGCIPDPCAGIPEEGVCEGDVAIRCSLPDEGPRRRLETDCTLLGVTCTSTTGMAACDTPPGPTCAGNCGSSSTGPDGLTCFCDTICREIGDCCSDVEVFCPIDTSTNTAGGFLRF